MKAPKVKILFQLYIVAEDSVIGVVLIQVVDGNEHIIIYLSQRLIDVEKGILSLKSNVYPYLMLAPN
jgi:hypothetical protein